MANEAIVRDIGVSGREARTERDIAVSDSEVTCARAASSHHSGLWVAAFDPFDAPNPEGNLRLLRSCCRRSPDRADLGGCRVLFDGILFSGSDIRNRYNLPDDPGRGAAALLAKAYLAGGLDFLNELMGVFALLLWDSRNKVLLAVRDRLGTHPLFYCKAGGELLFSSSAAALLRHPHVSKPLNRQVMAEHLSRQ